MENEKITGPKINFEQDNADSILIEEIEAKTREIDKLKKKINYVAFFTFILISAFATIFYFNLSNVMLEVKEGGSLKVENLSKEIDAKIATLSALSVDFKEDTTKHIETLKKEAENVKKNFNNMSGSLKRIEEIEKVLKSKPNQEDLKKISDDLTNKLQDKPDSADLKKISEELRKEVQTSMQSLSEQSLTKNVLEERIKLLEKDLRIKLLRISGDTENLIANAKEKIEKDTDKKMSRLIKEFEISMQNYVRQNLQRQDVN